jgi:hypothetical protein
MKTSISFVVVVICACQLLKEMNAQSATLTATPSNAIAVGSPMNLTCIINPMPLTNNIYVAMADSASASGAVRPIIRISTIMMRAMLVQSLYGRVAIDMVDNVTLVMEYAYTTPADAGVYLCLVLNSVTSNQLSVTMLPATTGSPTTPENVPTPPPPTQAGRTMLAVQPKALTTPPSWYNNLPPTPQPGPSPWYNNVPPPQPAIMPANVGSSGTNTMVPIGTHLDDSQQTTIIWVIVTLATIAIVFGVTLIALRLKYKDRFCMATCRRKQKRACVYLPNGGTGNPVFVIDDQQLPSYTEAVKCAVSEQSFMPPSYTDAVAKQEEQNNQPEPAALQNVTIYQLPGNQC